MSFRERAMIGRIKEQEILEQLYDSKESEFLAVYGRRRIGKTYLIREVFSERFTFCHTGLSTGRLRDQLHQFHQSLCEYGAASCPRPVTWFEAFEALKKLIQQSPQKRKVVFIDEMPWMDTLKSNFLTSLESFWNGWCAARKDVLFIVCGSASSWILKNLFHNRGGLHNRITSRIHLQPFTLRECEKYAEDRNLKMTRADIAQCYMALGGIPYYWRYLQGKASVAQNLDRLFFAEDAPMRTEFAELCSSLFKDASFYEELVALLAQKKSGLTRKELAASVKTRSSAKLSACLDTLEASGFIRRYKMFGNKVKDSIYQLIDNFTLFHFAFLKNLPTDEHFWENMMLSPKLSAWRGLAFEHLCLQHQSQLRKALGIYGIHTEASTWFHKGDDIYPQGAQIDLLLDRADNVINVCEMKFSQGLYAINKETHEELTQKVETFRQVTRTRKAIHLTLITTNGLLDNAYAHGVQSQVKLDDLFDND